MSYMSNLSQHGNIIDRQVHVSSNACTLLLLRNPKPFYEVINYYVTVDNNFSKNIKTTAIAARAQNVSLQKRKRGSIKTVCCS